MLHVFYQNHTKHIKISPSYSWTNLHCQNDRLVHQTEPRKHSIVLSVTHMLCVNQVCHGVGRFVKDGSSSSSSLEWKSMNSINGISYYVNKCYTLSDTLQMTIFLSGRQHCACNTVQLLQRFRLIQHLVENVIVYPMHWIEVKWSE